MGGHSHVGVTARDGRAATRGEAAFLHTAFSVHM